jgi:putative transposase
MYLTTIFRILPKAEELKALESLIYNFDVEVNKVLLKYLGQDSIVDVRFLEIKNTVPWDSKIEVIKQASLNFKLIKKNEHKLIKLNNLFCVWTPRNFRFLNNQETQLLIQNRGRSSCILDINSNDYLRNVIDSHRLFSLKIKKRGRKWIGLLTYYQEPKENTFQNTMGVDLGIKVPAVAVTSTGKVRFFGNGRQIKFIHRQQRKKLKQNKDKGNKKNYSWKNKLKAIDHKISREIIDFAIQEQVKVIKLENLNRLQKRNSKVKGVPTWSYSRLLSYIKYKARKEGIIIKLIDERYTSKRCPSCKTINNVYDRNYFCFHCGYKNHRDIVGALNILNANLSQKTCL